MTKPFSFTLCFALALIGSAAHAQLVVGVQSNASHAAVWRVDVATGHRSLLFYGGAGAIAVDDAGGRIFAANGSVLSVWNYGGGQSATQLGTVRNAAGVALPISGMAFGGGRLFAAKPFSHAPAGAWLFEVDLATLVATPIVANPTVHWVEEISFDASTGTFLMQEDGAGSLYRMDILGGGSPQLVGSIGFGPDGGALGANGLYYVTYDNPIPFRVFDLATNAYTSTSFWCPYYFDLDNAGADWAPSLVPPSDPRVYCAPTPAMVSPMFPTYAGTPSASAGSGFVITHTAVPTGSRVHPHFSLTGAASAPFAGGLRCVRTPVFRMPQAHNVTFSHSLDFNAYIASGANPGLVSGQTVWFQLAAQSTTGANNGTFSLSPGLRFTIAP